MTGLLIPAALYQAPTRLAVALVLAGLFALVLPRRSPRPLAVVVIGVIVVCWLFGATLIWGTGGPSKLRWGLDLNVWEGAVLLAVAAAGVLSAGIALRSFAHRKPGVGWTFAGFFGVAFAAWSLVVRYPTLFALVVLATGIAALALASRPPETTGASDGAGRTASPALPAPARWSWGTITAALPLLSGFAFYWWLELSPKSWADPACGLPGWLPFTVLPFVAVPAISAWTQTRALGKSREAAVAAIVLVSAVTIGAAIVAFLCWFGVNRCGE